MKEETYVKFSENGDLHKALYDTENNVYIVDGKTYESQDVSECDSDGIPFDDDDTVYTLTPMSIFAISLHKTNIIGDEFDYLWNRSMRTPYDIFEQKMYDNGYITKENGERNNVENPESPSSIFNKVVSVFFPDSSENQREIAFDIFKYYMKNIGYA